LLKSRKSDKLMKLKLRYRLFYYLYEIVSLT